MTQNAKSRMVSFRTEEGLQAALIGAARANGRSLSSEIELRLRASLEAEDEPSEAQLVSPRGALLRIMQLTTNAAGQPWWERHYSWELVRSSVDYIIRQWEPPEDPKLSEVMSASGLAAVRQWQELGGDKPAQREGEERELEELRLKEEVLGLSEEERTRCTALEASIKKWSPAPMLGPEDQQAWLSHREREAASREIWRRLQPLLTEARQEREARQQEATKWRSRTKN